ncbi:MAG: hypothetical protein IK065_07350 [Neisseriaceae bacterium]|nr:hypothetical protein [Neisseriaceae bacterium]
MNKTSLFWPFVLIIFGSVWFLHVTDILPPSTIILSIAMIVAGFIVLIVDGINKQSFVSAPLLIYCGVAIYLHFHTDVMLSVLLSLGMIIAGLLMLIANTNLVPHKKGR